MEVPPLDPDQCEFLHRVYPDTAADWIAGYPDLVSGCLQRWGLEVTGRASGGYPTNVVLFVRDASGAERVLKVGHPHPEQITEMIALEAYAGDLTPAVIEADRSRGALLLERVRPGNTYRESPRRNSDDALEIFARLPRQAPMADGLPRFADWMAMAFDEFRRRFDAGDDFHAHLDRAGMCFDALGGETWVLHGDLHHENLLEDATRGWVAIDPKGVFGPRVMECGRFVHNFLSDEADARDVDAFSAIAWRRCLALSGVMGVEPGTIAKAGYADATLSTCWTLNAGLGHERLEVAAMAALV